MHAYRLSLTFQAAPVFNTINPLDAVIAGILYQQNPGTKPDLTPYLAHEKYEEGDAIPLASLPLLPEGTKRFNIAMRPDLGKALVRSAAMQYAVDPKATAMRKGGDYPSAHTYQRGTIQRVIDTTEIDYLFTGDGERIADLITRAGAIGAQRSKGYGALDPLRPPTINEVESEYPIGILDETGTLIRPVPIMWAHKRGLKNWRSGLNRYTIPYRPEDVARYGCKTSAVAWPNDIAA